MTTHKIFSVNRFYSPETQNVTLDSSRKGVEALFQEYKNAKDSAEKEKVLDKIRTANQESRNAFLTAMAYYANTGEAKYKEMQDAYNQVRKTYTQAKEEVKAETLQKVEEVKASTPQKVEEVKADTTSDGLVDKSTTTIVDTTKTEEKNSSQVDATEKNNVNNQTTAPQKNEPTKFSETIVNTGIQMKDFRNWIKQAEGGNMEAAKKVAMVVFSDFDGKYMPRIPLLKWAGMNGEVVEKTNKVRLFGRDGHKQSVGELQMYHIIKNNEQLTFDFMLSVLNGANIQSLSMDDVRKAQNVLFERLEMLSEIQQVITGKPFNASVDIPTVLAGNEGAYIQNLLSSPKYTDKIQGLPPSALQKWGDKLKSIGVTVPLLGAYTRFESRNLGATEVEKMKGHPLSIVLGETVNFTGKLSALAATAQLNLNDRERKILVETNEFGKKLQSLQNPTMEQLAAIDPSLKDSAAVQAYMIHKDKISYANLVDVLVHNKLLDAARADLGWELKGVEATIGLFGVGLGISAQKIGIGYRETDGTTRRAVSEGIRQNAPGLATYREVNGKHEYTLRPIAGLEAHLRSVDPSANISKTADGKIVFTTTKAFNINANVDVRADGNEEIHYSISQVSDVTNTTQLEGVTMDDGKAVEMTREYAHQKFANDIYNWSRRDAKFEVGVIQAISRGDYATAIATLKSDKKYESVLKAVTDGDVVKENRMQELLTYTYGGSTKLSQGTMSSNIYKSSRLDRIVKNEAALIEKALGVKAQITESAFEGKTHTPTSAATLYKNQHISMSVVATPANNHAGKNPHKPTHRLDNFDSALEISNVTHPISDINMKRALLEKAHSNRVDSEVKRINEKLGLKISREDYIAIVLGEKAPDSIVDEKGRKLKIKDAAQFFEARAMANGNVCNNLTYGIAFPNFMLEGTTITTTVPGKAEVAATLGAGNMIEHVEVTEVAIGTQIGGGNTSAAPGEDMGTNTTPVTDGSKMSPGVSTNPTGNIVSNPNISGGGSITQSATSGAPYAQGIH